MKLEEKMKKVIGNYTTIKTTKTSRVGGTIIDCKFHQYRKTKKSQKAQYQITLESGTKKVVNSYIVEQLPKDQSVVKMVER